MLIRIKMFFEKIVQKIVQKINKIIWQYRLAIIGISKFRSSKPKMAKVAKVKSQNRIIGEIIKNHEVIILSLFSITTIILILLVFIRPSSNQVVKPNQSVVSSETSSTAINKPSIDEVLQNNGWKPPEYTTDPVVNKDKSTAGNGAFTNNPIRTVQGLIGFLNSKTTASNTLFNKALEYGTAAEIVDPSNWTAIQANVDFSYDGNTMLSSGKVINSGSRSGNKGDIFFVFISPSTGKALAVRGACANPQAVIPNPKSSNPADYKKPGDDKTKDAGTGTMPKSPLVSQPAESKPPTVSTGDNKPGDSTNISAPNSTSSKANTSSSPTLPPESGVNPKASSSTPSPNSGDPGNPWG